MSHLFSKPVLGPEFYCSRCRKYKPASAKCNSLLCCSNCKEKVLAADNADKEDEVKKTRVNHLGAKIQKGLSVKMYEREMTNIIFDDWMNDGIGE